MSSTLDKKVVASASGAPPTPPMINDEGSVSKVEGLEGAEGDAGGGGGVDPVQLLVLSFDGRIDTHTATNEPWDDWQLSNVYRKVAMYCVVTRKLKITEEAHPQSWNIYDKRAGEIIECDEECIATLEKDEKVLKLKRVKLINNGGWTSVNDTKGKRNISIVDGPIEDWAKVKQKYLYIDNEMTEVRQDISGYSLFYHNMKAGDVVDISSECIINWNGSKLKRLKLERDKGWVNYNTVDGRRLFTKLNTDIALDAYAKINDYYVCISKEGEPVKTEAAIESDVVGKVRLGDVITTTDEVIVPHNEDTLKIKRVRVTAITSTTRLPAEVLLLGWASIQSVTDGQRIFSKVDSLIEKFKKVKQRYLCVNDDGVKVRREASLSSALIKTFQIGEQFSGIQEFILPMSESFKSKTVFLKNGMGFANILDNDKKPQLYPIDGLVSKYRKIFRRYLCIEDVEPVDIREQISITSEVLFTLSCGDLIETSEECVLEYVRPRIKRLKCIEENGWVSYNQNGKQFFSWIESPIENYKRVKVKYLCCVPEIKSQLDAALSSDEVGVFQGGDLIPTTDECTLLLGEGKKMKRLKLEGEGWISWNSPDSPVSYLSMITESYEKYNKVAKRLLCIYTTEIFDDVSFDSKQLQILKAGDIVDITDEVTLIFPTYKIIRMRLSTGKWVSWNLPTGRSMFSTLEGPIQDYVRVKRKYMVSNWDGLAINVDMPLGSDVVSNFAPGTVISTTEECTLVFETFQIRRARLENGTWTSLRTFDGIENLTLVDGLTLNFKKVQDYYLYVDNSSVPVRESVSLKSNIVSLLNGGDQILAVEECIMIYKDYKLKRLKLSTGGWTSLISTDDGHKLFTNIDGFITDYQKVCRSYFTCCYVGAPDGLPIYREASLHSATIGSIKPGKTVATFQECTLTVGESTVRRLRLINNGGWINYNSLTDAYNYAALVDTPAFNYKRIYQKYLLTEDVDVTIDISPMSQATFQFFSGNMISAFEEVQIVSMSSSDIKFKRLRLENGLGWVSHSSDIDGHKICFKIEAPAQEYKKLFQHLLYIGDEPLPVNQDISPASPVINLLKPGDAIFVVDECSIHYNFRKISRMRIKDNDGFVNRNVWLQSVYDRVVFTIFEPGSSVENFKAENKKWRCSFDDLVQITSEIGFGSLVLNNEKCFKRGDLVETMAYCDLTYGNLNLRRYRLKERKGWITGAITDGEGRSIQLLQPLTLMVRYKELKTSVSSYFFGEENTFDFRIALFQADLEMLKSKGICENAAKDGGIYDLDLDDLEDEDHVSNTVDEERGIDRGDDDGDDESYDSGDN